MTRDDKITQIMALVGVAPSDFDAARRNYMGVDDKEIDSQLSKFREGKSALAEWRKQRGPALPAMPKVAATPGERVIERPEPIAAESDWLGAVSRWRTAVAQNLERLAEVIRRFDTIGRHTADELFQLLRLWETARLRGPFRIPELPDSSLSDVFGQHLSQIAASNEVIAHLADYGIRAATTVLGHPLVPSETSQLTLTGYTEALARLENVVLDNPPDVIVGLNEGWAIGRTVKDHLGLRADLVALRGTAETQFEWKGRARRSSGPTVVWVVGHVAKTGVTLSKAINEARRVYDTDHVFGTVLAASLEAAQHFEAEPFVRYHQVTEATPFLDRAREDMRRLYPVEPMPWAKDHR